MSIELFVQGREGTVKHMTKPDRVGNFLTTVLLPFLVAVVPAYAGFLLSSTSESLVRALALCGVLVAGFIVHLLAIDWRETKLGNAQLCRALREKLDEQPARDGTERGGS